MKRSARVVVLVSGDRLVEGRVRGAIQRNRGNPTIAQRERTPNGFVRYLVDVSVDTEDTLRSLVMGIESIPGAAVQNIEDGNVAGPLEGNPRPAAE